MGRNPWDDDPDIQALRGRSSGTKWSRVFWGLVLVGMATFAAAYYLPLFRAHDTLTSEHVRVLKEAENSKRALQTTEAELKKVSARRDELEAQRKLTETGDAAASSANDALKSQVEAKLDKLIKKGLAEVGMNEGRLVIGVADAGVLAPKKVEFAPAAKAWLCELANLAGPRGLRVRAVDADEKPDAALSAKYPTTWSLRAARAAALAEGLEFGCSTPGTRIQLEGAGGAAKPNPALPNSKLPASHFELEFGK